MDTPLRKINQGVEDGHHPHTTNLRILMEPQPVVPQTNHILMEPTPVMPPRIATRATTPSNNDDEMDDINEMARQQATADREIAHTPPKHAGLRKKRTPNYSHLKGRENDGSLTAKRRIQPSRKAKRTSTNKPNNKLSAIAHMVFTQYGIKQGIKKFGDAGKKYVVSELTQFHDRKVGTPKNPKFLTGKQRRRALQYLMFLKKKNDGKIKSRGCADGRSQRNYIPKEDTSSPTVNTESILISCLIDALQGRDVATVDIPGAFMHADMKGETVHVKLEGLMARIMVEIDPKNYEPCLVTENGKPTLYIELDKALYGTVQAAMLFWENLSSLLIKWGFKINPYDACVANKTINGRQCTIVWHVDDLKISHVDPNVVSMIINKLDNEYGQEIVEGKRASVMVKRGKGHEYLGMTLDYTEPGAIKVDMTQYIEKMLDEVGDRMDGIAKTPAANNLFEVRPDSPFLDKEKADFFHSTVAKSLFLCKRGRPDIQTAMSFLCTRVQTPNEDDWIKLARMIKYLRYTKHLVLRLMANNLHTTKWWVDAAFGVHHNMRSHTGGAMSMGTGVCYGTSQKQKLNTRSSTEAELVGTDDVLPRILWIRLFLEAQGHDTMSNLKRDNQSTMRLESNGKLSSTRRTRHLNNRYFLSLTSSRKSRSKLNTARLK